MELFERAKRVLPGGVNSPVRAFAAVGGAPRFIDRANGPMLYDTNGQAYIDYVCSWGPMILGHNHPEILDAVQKTAKKGFSFGAATELEVLFAEAITAVAPVEMLRMVTSGTEAVMSAVRLARGYTKRGKIIKFAGCYHGHADSMLVAAGSGALTNGVPDSAGVPVGVANDTLIARYNDLTSVQALLNANIGDVAAIIVEPVAANMGVVLPAEGFLQGLRTLCDAHNALLIFDEVITGFRLGIGGAQEYFGIKADLVTYGKIIGAGMPVGAYGGARKIMEHVAPLGAVYQAGTLAGNPLAMAAGLAQLSYLRQNPQIYKKVNELAVQLAAGLREIIAQSGIEACVNQIGSLCCMFLTKGPVTTYEQAKKSDATRYAQYFNKMLRAGIYLAPAQFEAMFISAAHTEEMIEKTLETAKIALTEGGLQ